MAPESSAAQGRRFVHLLTLKGLIRDQWPHRHSYFGLRMTLRSMIRHARSLRDA